MSKIYPLTLDDLQEARRGLHGFARQTPLVRSEVFSKRFGRDIYIKLECAQRTGSYKIRGAFNKIRKLPHGQRQKGVVAASAGNHAQGVALAATHFEIESNSVIIMPKDAPHIKIQKTAAYGTNKEKKKQQGDRYQGISIQNVADSYDHAKLLEKQHSQDQDKVAVPAFDDWDVIAGQATITLEVLDQLGYAPDLLLVPVGGGGLISGALIALRESGLSTDVLGVESEEATCFLRSLQNGQAIDVPVTPNPLCDGIAVRRPGEKTWPVVQALSAGLIAVPRKRVEAAIIELYQRHGWIVEGAGAVTLAGLNARLKQLESTNLVYLPQDAELIAKAQSIVLYLTGSNIDEEKFDSFEQRGLKLVANNWQPRKGKK